MSSVSFYMFKHMFYEEKRKERLLKHILAHLVWVENVLFK